MVALLNNSCGKNFSIRFWNPIESIYLASYFNKKNLRRSHDKILYLKSQKIAYGGDRNWQNVNYRRDTRRNSYTYLSLDAVVQGPVVDQVKNYLDSVWKISRPMQPEMLAKKPKDRYVGPRGKGRLVKAKALRRNQFLREDYQKAREQFQHQIDTLVRIEQSVDQAAREVGSRNWRTSFQNAGKISFLHFSPMDRLNGVPDQSFNKVLENMMNGAKEKLVVATPFVRLPFSYMNALTDKAKELEPGKVEFFTGAQDSKLKPHVFRLENRDVKKLQRAGVLVRKNSEMDPLHVEAMVVDGKTSYLGTHNFNMRSEHVDLESGFMFQDPKVAQFIEGFLRSNSSDELYQIQRPWTHFLLVPIVVPLLSIPTLAEQL